MILMYVVLGIITIVIFLVTYKLNLYLRIILCFLFFLIAAIFLTIFIIDRFDNPPPGAREITREEMESWKK